VNRVTRPRLGFPSFDAAQYTLAGIERMPMLTKGQMVGEEGQKVSHRPNTSRRWPPHHQIHRPHDPYAENLRENQLRGIFERPTADRGVIHRHPRSPMRASAWRSLRPTILCVSLCVYWHRSTEGRQ
jgi:hypothetical protein